MEPRPMTLARFAKERGLTTTADVDSHIHAGLRSKPETKTYDRWHKRRFDELRAARDQTEAAYRAAIDAGEVRELTRIETLRATARGNADNRCVIAARRVLIKRAMRLLSDA